MATIKKFEDLEIWQLASDVANDIFEIYKSSPAFQKDFKLWDQINGSSGSVMDNIAEGFERGSRNEFINFLSFAKGSAGEVKSQLYRARHRNYFSLGVFNILYEKTDKVGNKIGKFIGYLNKSTFKGSKFKERSRI